MDKLISIQDHSDWLHNLPLMAMSQRWDLHRQRVNFGKQQLEIWQFVPCKLVDGVWVVLEVPIYNSNETELEAEWKEYQEAKERCLFEGFEYDSKMEYWHNNDISFDEEYIESKTIEDIVKYNLELTPTAQKQISN